MKAGKKHDAGNGAEPANICPPAAVSQSTEHISNNAEAHTEGNYNTVTQVVGSDHVNITINNKSASNPLLPMQIAPPPPDFTGREEELKELVDAVQKGGTTISGL